MRPSHTLVTTCLTVIFLSPIDGWAGTKGQIAAGMADFEDYKIKTLAALQHADDLRAEKHSAFTEPLIALLREIGEAEQTVHRQYNEQIASELKARSGHEQSRILLTIFLGLEQLRRALEYELLWQFGQKNPLLLSLRTKAEEMFQLTDRELRTIANR